MLQQNKKRVIDRKLIQLPVSPPILFDFGFRSARLARRSLRSAKLLSINQGCARPAGHSAKSNS
jgi:hypothetical protein